MRLPPLPSDLLRTRAGGAGASLWQPASDRVTVAAFQIGWYAVRHLPEPAAYRLFEALADVLLRRNGKGVRRLRSNYARVRPELTDRALDALVREGMRSYLRYYCEMFRLGGLSRERLGDIVHLERDTRVRELVAQGRPVVVFIGHMGNWDLAGAWSTQYLAPVTTVAERLEPEEIFTGFVALREALGMTILPLTGGPEPFEELTGAIRRGALVPLLADRDLTNRGVEVDFCGHRARMAKGPAALSLLTGAPLFAAAIYYVPARELPGIGGRQLQVTFSDEITPPPGLPTDAAVTAMTAACARHLERFVREHTPEWHMLQRVFTEDLHPAGGAHP